MSTTTTTYTSVQNGRESYNPGGNTTSWDEITATGFSAFAAEGARFSLDPTSSFITTNLQITGLINLGSSSSSYEFEIYLVLNRLGTIVVGAPPTPADSMMTNRTVTAFTRTYTVGITGFGPIPDVDPLVVGEHWIRLAAFDATTIDAQIPSGTTGTLSIELDSTIMSRFVPTASAGGQPPDFTLAFIRTQTISTLRNFIYSSRPQLVVVGAIEADTGRSGRVDAQSRVDRCPKCGFATLRELWVMDGFRKHLVCPHCWDPKDPLESPRHVVIEGPGLNEEDV